MRRVSRATWYPGVSSLPRHQRRRSRRYRACRADGSGSGSTPSLPRVLAADDVQRVLAAVDETRPSGPRDRAILLLLIRLGLRAGEVAALTVNDIDWHDGSVRVVGKGGAGATAAVGRRCRGRPGRRVALAVPDQFARMWLFVTARPPYRQLRRPERVGHRQVDAAARRRQRRAARRPCLPAHLCVADGPPGRADERSRICSAMPAWRPPPSTPSWTARPWRRSPCRGREVYDDRWGLAPELGDPRGVALRHRLRHATGSAPPAGLRRPSRTPTLRSRRTRSSGPRRAPRASTRGG